jgi:hypothetical protein
MILGDGRGASDCLSSAVGLSYGDFSGGIRIGIGTGSETGLEIAKITRRPFRLCCYVRAEEENSTEKGGAPGTKS